jgi:dihydroxyacetone kinase-like protein
MLTSAALEEFFRAFLAAIEREQARLDALDAVVGDGDHGATMVMGMRHLVAGLPDDEGVPPGELLRIAARRFAWVGGSTGPLWGTALLRAAQSLGDQREPDLDAWARAIDQAAVGIAFRGGCQEGDRTLLDVMAPAARTLGEAAAEGRRANEAMSLAHAAAVAGLARTRELTPRRGRARRVAERAYGHEDAGAASAVLAWETAARLVGRPSAVMDGESDV